MITMTATLAGNKTLRHIEQVRTEWKKALLEEGRAIKSEYEKTTETWKHHVTFNIRPHVSGRVNWYVDVFSSGPNSRIYWFVHEGIKVGRAVFSTDWSPKTQPRVLSSGPGSGRLLYVSKKINIPNPYEPRQFTDTIIAVRQKPFEKRMQHATAVGARKATQGG